MMPTHSATAAPMLEARGLTRQFAGFHAVQGVDIAIAPGTVHAIIGPNGAGKTTVFNLLSRFLPASGGQIFYDGAEITAVRPARVARMGLVRSFQIPIVFARLSVLDNVRLALQSRQGALFTFWRSRRTLDVLNDRALEIIAAVGLEEFIDRPAAELSHGRKRILEIAATLALDPKMLLLDEPMAGLGTEDIARISHLIRSVSRSQTVLLVEHNLSVVAELSDRITVMARGRVIAEGSYAEVAADKTVREAYIGS